MGTASTPSIGTAPTNIHSSEKKIPEIFPTFSRFLLSNSNEGGDGLQRITEKELIGVIYENKVYFTRMARRFLHSDADVEDVIQETIYRTFKSFNTLNELAYLKTSLTRILINQCINLLRKSPPAPITAAVETGAKDANYHKTEIRQLVEMLEQDLREVAILYY